MKVTVSLESPRVSGLVSKGSFSTLRSFVLIWGYANNEFVSLEAVLKTTKKRKKKRKDKRS